MGLFKHETSAPPGPPAYTPTGAPSNYQAPPVSPGFAPNQIALGLFQGPPIGRRSRRPSACLPEPEPQFEVPNGFGTTFASLSMHMGDRLRLMQFPPSTVHAVKQAITATWPRGIQSTRVYAGSDEIQLCGNPWRGNDAIDARRMMKGILESLYDEGWVLCTSTNCMMKQQEKDTLIFKYHDPKPAQCEWMSVSFVRQDHLRLIDAPWDFVTSLIGILKNETQSHGAHAQKYIYDLKMTGYPWTAVGTSTMRARLILLKLIEALELHGFAVYASVEQDAKDEEEETDVWHCYRKAKWVPGGAVYFP